VNTDEIAGELRGYIRTRFGVPQDDPDFSDSVNLFDFGYVDSLGAAELMSFVAKRFDIRFEDADWVQRGLSTIDQIAAFVAERREQRS
jgi:methoxymalonate biosynthesis acyl carrier protein